MEPQPLGDLFDRIQLFKNGLNASSMPDLNNCLMDISTHATKDGLTDSQLTDLVHFIPNNELGIETVKLLLDCLIPTQYVPSVLARKIVTYVLMNYRTLHPQKIIPFLRWIIGVLEFKLTDLKIIDGFYRLYFFMLDYTDFSVHKYVAQIIYMLTKPDDVVEEKVYHVRKIMARYNRPSNHLVVLMSKFKSYKPELVQKKIPDGKELEATVCLTEKMATGFKNAAHRNSPSEEGMQVDDVSTNLTNTQIIKEKSKPEKCLEKILNCYNSYSNVYTYSKTAPLHKVMLQDIDNLYDLLHNINVIELPTNILSLLLSDIGMNYIALANHDVQERFAISLYDILDKVFLKKVLKNSKEEKEALLKGVANLETMMQQGIKVVTRFLGKYLVFWDGEEFRQTILTLIEWATFSSYAELEEMILSNLYNTFCTSQCEVKIEIITCLCNLLLNMYFVDLERFKNDIKPPFVGAHAQWVSDTKTLKSMLHAIDYFLLVGLIAEPKSNALLHRAITFYSLVNKMEKNKPVMTVVNFAVVYRSMFAQNSAAFRRISELILSYRSKISQLDPEEASNNIYEQNKVIDRYVNDIMNCLWHGKAFSNRESGLIFAELTEDERKELRRVSDGKPDTAFVLSNNMMLVPYIYHMLKNSPEFDLATITSKDKLWELLGTHLDEVSDLITDALESDNQNSGMLSYI